MVCSIFARNWRRFTTIDPVGAVLSAPLNPKPKHHPENPVSKISEISPGVYLKGPVQLKGNDLRLATGKAQALRVNDPNRFVKTDELGNSTYNPESDKVGVYRGHIYGGPDFPEATMEIFHAFGSTAVNKYSNQVKTACIYYRTSSHMHNVSTADHYGNGPWVISFETWGGSKCPLDGSRVSSDPRALRHIKGFLSAEDAIKYCNDYGFAYTVLPPRFRHHTKKNYADNFKYRPK